MGRINAWDGGGVGVAALGPLSGTPSPTGTLPPGVTPLSYGVTPLSQWSKASPAHRPASTSCSTRPPSRNSVGSRRPSSQGGCGRRSQSTGCLNQEAAAEVRLLAKNPYDDYVQTIAWDDGSPWDTGEHAKLKQRLRSPAAKRTVEQAKAFLLMYRRDPVSAFSDNKLNGMIKQCEDHAVALQMRAEYSQAQTADADRRLERVSQQQVRRATDEELQKMSTVQRKLTRVQEDKNDETLKRLRDEAQSVLSKVQRRQQIEQQELRDYRVIIREYRRIRLEKLQDTMASCEHGYRLRTIVREMVRHGGQKLLSRLEQVPLPLEPWMREVVLNTCHLEVRLEKVEAHLRELRLGALSNEAERAQCEDVEDSTPHHGDSRPQSQEERMHMVRRHGVDQLLTRTRSRRTMTLPAGTPPPISRASTAGSEPERRGSSSPLPADGVSVTEVWVQAGDFIEVIEFVYSDGSRRKIGKGGKSPKPKEPFKLHEDEHLVGVAARNGDFGFEGCCFRTNAGRYSLWFGGHGGEQQVHKARMGHEIVSLRTASSGDYWRAVGIHEQGHDIDAAVKDVEAEIGSIRRLLIDMRENIAAVMGQRMKDLERGGSRTVTAWGRSMLELMVSETTAKATIKDLQRSTLTSKMMAA